MPRQHIKTATMRYFFLTLTVIIFLSCNIQSNESAVVKVSNLAISKRIADTIFWNIEKNDRKMISRKQMDSICRPLQFRLDSLRLIMIPTDVDSLDKYRSALLVALADRKVKNYK